MGPARAFAAGALSSRQHGAPASRGERRARHRQGLRAQQRPLGTPKRRGPPPGGPHVLAKRRRVAYAVSATGSRSSSGNSSSISSPSSASSFALARISSCRARSRENPKCSPSSFSVMGLSFMIRCSMM